MATDVAGLSVREVRYQASVEQPRHHHEHTTATLVLDGSLEEGVGSVRERALPLSVVFKPAGTEHRNHVGPRGAYTFQLSFESEFLETSGTSVCPSEWGWAHGGSATRRFLGLLTGWRSTGGDPLDIESLVYDLLGDLWNTGHCRESARSRGVDAPSWLRAVVDEIEDTFDSPRRVRDLAADAGVHPVALARAHRRHFDCSISDRIQARRVSRAADLLGHFDVALTSVAFRAGFADQSHLTRVFKTRTGVTPGRYRRLLAV